VKVNLKAIFAVAAALLAKPFKLPANLAHAADQLYETQHARLALKGALEDLKKRETQLREHLIAKLPKSDSTGVAGKLARASVYTTPEPLVEDWPKFYKHVQKTGHFDLLHKRLSGDAVKSRWEAKEVVPGVGRINVPKVSLEKVK
jgi:hypothetical protein